MMRLWVLMNAIVAFLANSVVSSPFALAESSRRGTKHHSEPAWGGFDLETDYYTQTPDTGVVREYFFDITNTTAAPDGRERSVLLVNGQLPGPTIEANWGDTIRVHVTNSMADNGTSIHFHGIRQFWSNQNDGVQSLTQCPIAPGTSYTYTWRATQYGSSWYHSHFSLQAWEGVFGGIVIHGPATAEYDDDLGILFLNDWSEVTADAMYQRQLESLDNPQMQGGLINGTNVYQYPNGSTVGKRFETTFKPGRSYLLRLVNAAIHSHFKFSIDGHKLLVISTDFVPIKPFETTVLDIGMGQRYDVIVTADQATDSYWLRAHPQTFCSNNTAGDNIKGIIRYDEFAAQDPCSTPWNITDEISCVDMSSSLLVPWLSMDVPLERARNTSLPIGLDPEGDPSLYLWSVGGSVFNVSWQDPSLLKTLSRSEDWVAQAGAIEINRPEEWVVIIMETQMPVSHPIHLHGHDFFILSQGQGAFANSTKPLQTSNPPRRDVAQLNSNGHLVIAFQADNPGAWLMHCHIGFHATEGFAAQFLERKHEIPSLIDRHTLEETCSAWKTYGERNPAGVQDRTPFGPYDSGV